MMFATITQRQFHRIASYYFYTFLVKTNARPSKDPDVLARYDWYVRESIDLGGKNQPSFTKGPPMANGVPSLAPPVLPRSLRSLLSVYSHWHH
jgi:hypothetical protein